MSEETDLRTWTVEENELLRRQPVFLPLERGEQLPIRLVMKRVLRTD